MTTLSRLRLLSAAALVSSAAALSAVAQTQTPPPETQPTPPAAKPEPAPTPPTGMNPAEPAKSPTLPSGNPQSAAPAKNPMIGLTIFSSDGNKLGSVQSVDAGPDGKAKAIRFKTGGFLGFGGKLVEVPEGKFTKSGDNVQLGLTADEVSKLPEVKNQS
jgi:ABC-type transport system substrate-binding protein